MKSFEQNYAQDFSRKVIAGLKTREHLTLDFVGEDSQFIRFNQAKVRQSGLVHDSLVDFKFILEGSNNSHKKLNIGFTLSRDLKTDLERAENTLKKIREEIEGIPSDPYIKLPENLGSTNANHEGKLLDKENAVETILNPAQGKDFTGIYAAGKAMRANINSQGQSHWFSTESFILDYSLYNGEKSVKKCYAGRDWENDAFQTQMQAATEQLQVMIRETRKVARQGYRTYLAPDAVSDLLGMLSWGGVSEAGIRQGHSALRLVRSGERKLSPLFSVEEDFAAGTVPQFNSDGEVAPKTLYLIVEGKLENTLVSSRSAKEYGVNSNAASTYEMLRSPSMRAGKLKEQEILKELGTGLYLSNLNYLNWSDQQGGRITGLTRYACFWVEKGEIVAPIETMRFDDTIFNLFGSQLEALTEKADFIPNTSTYEFRELGGLQCPGMLLKEMQFW